MPPENPVCPECGRVFDLLDENDASEWFAGHDCEVVPTCDICDEPEDHEVGMIEYDWNGETGNHLSCERWAERQVQS